MENIDEKKIIKIIIAIALIYLVVQNFNLILNIFIKILHIIMPFLMGVIFAYILNLLLRIVEKNYFPRSRNKIIIKLKRPICVVLTFLIIVAIIAAVIWLIVPEMINGGKIIGREIPQVFDHIKGWLMKSDFDIIKEKIADVEINWDEMLNGIVNYATSGMGGILSSTISVVSSVATSIVNVLLGIVFSIYALCKREQLINQINRIADAFIPEKRWRQVKKILYVANDTFSSFIMGQCMEAVILGMLCAIGMAVFRFPYAIMIGTVVGVTALIPLVGAYLGAAVGAFLILTVSPFKAVMFIVFIIVLQELERYLIYPRVVGSSVGLPGIWVLVSITIGYGLLGVFGMLIGVPAFATIYKLLRDEVNNRNKNHKKESDSVKNTDNENINTGRDEGEQEKTY